MPGCEFVPSGNEYEFGIYFAGSVPLLLEVPAVEIAVYARIETFGYGEVAPVGVFHVECAAMPVAGRTCVLRHANSCLFEASARRGCISVLRIHLEPSPLVVAFGAVYIIGLPWPEGEERGDGAIFLGVGKVIGIGHDARLSFPHKPQVGVSCRLIDVAV